MLLHVAVTMTLAAHYVPRTTDDPTGSYSGVKQAGKDPYSFEFIEFALKKGSTEVKVTWVWGDESGERDRRELTFTALKIDATGVSGTVKGKRPASIPEKWKGKFVLRTPPSNAKGPVTPGLLLDGDWFVSNEEVPTD